MAILILFEHPDRELQVANAMAEIFRQRYRKSVVVASIIFHGHLCLNRKFVAIIVPSYKWKFIEFLSGCKPRLLVATLNYEQMLSQFNIQAFPPKGSFTLKNVIHFSWSEDFSEYLISNRVSKSNIYLVSKYIYQVYAGGGYRNPVTLVYGKKLKNFSGVIFVPLTDLQAFKTDLKLKREFLNKPSLKKAIMRRDYVLQTVSEIFYLLNVYAEENPDKLIVFRPHPSIGVEKYYELMMQYEIKEKDNFLISYDFSAIDWVLVSDVVVSNYSSVLMDALYFNKSSLIFEPKPLPENLLLPWMKNVYKVHDLVGFTLAVQKALDSTHIYSAKVAKSSGITTAVKVIISLLSDGAVIKDHHIGLGRRIIFFIKLLPYVLKCSFRLALYKLSPRLVKEGLRRDYRKIYQGDV
jgi:hypothetical protein